MKLIDKDALVVELEKRLDELYKLLPNASRVENGDINVSEACNTGKYTALESFKDYVDSFEVKESKLPNPRFPHLNNIVDKVFGTGNLESLEYEGAEQLVLLAKEELLKDLEMKEVDLEKEIDDWYNTKASKEFENVLYSDIEKYAKHFFELGLKAQKGE